MTQSVAEAPSKSTNQLGQFDIKLDPNGLCLIAAYSKNGRIIGNQNKLPWSKPEDLKFFKKRTYGHPVIMGRVSFDSLGKPLPGRRNIVLSRDKSLSLPHKEVIICHDLPTALSIARDQDKQPPFVIGGQQIYEQALNSGLVTHMFLTEILGDYVGDAFFPEFNENEWEQCYYEKKDGLIFRTLIKVSV